MTVIRQNQLLQEVYTLWKENINDPILYQELISMEKSLEMIEECFYKDLEFGTGGLRGILGVGTNRLNIYTIAKATQGYANYLNKISKNTIPTVAIAYDSRINSELFAKVSAEVFAGNNIHVFIYKELMPTPALSFAVRELECLGGVVITASHNPAQYNGYKVYGSDGGQITSKMAKEIYECMQQISIFEDVKKLDFEEAISQNKVEYIEEELISKYITTVSEESLSKEGTKHSLSIVYSPLNGSGLKPVMRILKKNGFLNVKVVKKQEEPDGHFSTCPKPNPEEETAMELAIELAKETKSEFIIATDPDCDRVGIAILTKDGYQLLNANQTGTLLFYYLCERKLENNTFPKQPVLAKTIVTTDMVKPIAQDYGVQVIETLTGFKYIGEQIACLEQEGREEDFLLGFEESYGYLTSTKIRDKDGVNAVLLLCEMADYYKEKGQTLEDVLENLYQNYGYYINSQKSFQFEGKAGFEKMQLIMKRLREEPLQQLAGEVVEAVIDYQLGERRFILSKEQQKKKEKIQGNLPASNVLKFELRGGSSFIVRPSGTEPKLKIYFSVTNKEKNICQQIEKQLREAMIDWIKAVE